MRLDSRQKLTNVAGENIVFQPARGKVDMNHVIAFNDTALFLYNQLKDRDFSLDDVVAELLAEYEVDEATARKDAAAWIAEMEKNHLLLQ